MKKEEEEEGEEKEEKEGEGEEEEEEEKILSSLFCYFWAHQNSKKFHRKCSK